MSSRIDFFTERMTDEVLSLVMEHPQVMWADVVIDKPHALRFSDSVSIALSARREGYASAHALISHNTSSMTRAMRREEGPVNDPKLPTN